MGYEIIWEPRGVVKRFFGEVTSDDMLKSVADSEGDSRFDELRFVINDFLDITAVSSSHHDVEEIAAIDSIAAVTNPRIKVAIVTTSPVVKEMAEGYINSPLNHYPTKIFQTLAEGRQWIAQTPTPTKPAAK